MAKSKNVFFCTECGYESNGWLGKCPGCGSWNTFVEERVNPDGSIGKGGNSFGFTAGIAAAGLGTAGKPVRIKEIVPDTSIRESTGLEELDRVMGGGIVRGSLVLVAGDPGIGKSTLMLMISGNLAGRRKVLYVSGEESESQIKMRGQRLGVEQEGLYIYSETSVDNIVEQIREMTPEYVVLDSIQTLEDASIASAPGSVSQVREITGKFLRIAKILGITVFIVGHVTKDGAIAGPRVLEHMVDTVLYFEGEEHLSYRVLRAVKNRFGSTNEIGVFEMCDRGLREVDNPSAAMLEGRPSNASGTAILCAMEGTRPMLLEIQALISSSALTNPRRMCAGLDYNRVSLLMAVLEKRAGFRLGSADAFINVVGGIRLNEPASDMAVCAAIMSSYCNIPLPDDAVYIGELGLTGEVRAVSFIDKRVSESFRLGFRQCFVPAGNRKNLTEQEGSGRIVYVDSIQALIPEK